MARVGQGFHAETKPLRGWFSFIGFVKRNGALPPAQRSRIHFVLNEDTHWQEVSIHALRCFSVDEISVEKVKIDA